MAIYCNVEGVWRRLPLTSSTGVAPRVWDRASGQWVAAHSVHANVHGVWRQVWPALLVPVTTLDVSASGGVWPAAGSVTVAIATRLVEPEFRTVVPTDGTVTVTSGEWSAVFPASQGTATFVLPKRDAGSYQVTAVWSEDESVSATGMYTIEKAVPTVTIEPAEQTIRAGQTCDITTKVRFDGKVAPAGGYTDIRRQTTTGGAFGGYYDSQAYTGDIARTIKPDVSVVWHSRLTGHPNLKDAVAGTTTWVLQKSTGYDDVAATGARTYNGSGNQKQDNYPVYHGYYGTNHGIQRGLIWLPALASGKTCTKVEVNWKATHMFHSKDYGYIAFGYHTLPNIPTSVSYTDTRIWQGAHGFQFNRGQEKWLHLTEMHKYVNGYRNGGFGIVVGHNSTSQDYYGYGQPLTIRYHWEKWS